MKYIAAHFVLLLVPFSSSLLAQKVQIFVSDGLGNEIPTESIRISNGSKTIDAPQDTPFELPYGNYTIVVEARGMSVATQPVVIDQPKQIVTVSLRLGALEGHEPPPCSIVGDIPPDSKITRMRIVEIEGSYLRDVPIEPNGKFQFRNLNCGDYLVVAMERFKLAGTMITKAEVMGPRLKLNLTLPGETH